MNVDFEAVGHAAGLVSRRLWCADQPNRASRHEGVILFADIAGFTVLTETARRRDGARGVEDLTLRLNELFAEMVGAVHAAGGDVLKFGGDALLVAFDRGSGAPDAPLRQAIWCADRLQRTVRRHRRTFGRALSLHLGLSAGSWEEAIAGTPGIRREHFVHGPSISAAMQAAADKDGCHLVASGSHCPSECAVELSPLERGHWRILFPGRPWDRDFEVPLVNASPETDLWDFVPTQLRSQLYQPGFDPLRAAEHRRVSTLFAFWRGYGSRSAVADGRSVWDDVFQAAFDVTEATGGLWARSDPGDDYQKLLFLFGAPATGDDDVDRALDGASQLRDRFRHLRSQHPRLRVRLGLTTAAVFTGYVGGPERFEFTAMGDGVNLAARLAARAPAGVVQLDPATQSAATRFRFRPGPVLTLKGVRDPVRAIHLVGPASDLHVVTDDDIVEHPDALEAAIRRWRETSERPLQIMADQGADERRFIAQLLRRLELPSESVQRIRFDPADGSHPHGGLRRLLAAINGGSATEELQEAIPRSGPTADLHEALFASEPLLARQLARTGTEAWGRQVANALAGLACLRNENGSERVLVLERMQNLSEVDRRVFSCLGDRGVPRLRLVMISELDRPAQGDASKGAIPLGPVTRKQLRAMMGQLWPSGGLSPRLLDYLYTQSGGLVRLARLQLEHLRQNGLLIPPRGKKGVWQFRAAAAVDLPDALRAHYIQRIDRLTPEAAEAVRAMAIFGEGANYVAVRHLCVATLSDDTLGSSVDELERTGLVERNTGTPGETLSFTDPACRRAVYQTMAFAAREKAHRRAAEYCRTAVPQNVDLIAEHLFRARDPNSLGFLDRAARRAEKLSLLDRARHLWRWSLLAASGHCDPEYKKIVPPLPAILSDRHRHLVLRFARILQTQAYFSEAGYLYRRLATDAAHGQQRTSEAAFRLQAARVDWLAGNYARARRPVSVALRLARTAGEKKLEGLAHYLAGDIDRRTGRTAAGQEKLVRAARILGEVGDSDSHADALNALGLVHWGLGRLTEAQTSFRAALKLRARSGDPAKRAQIANNLGLLLEEAGRLNAAERYYRRAFDIFDKLGARRNRAYALGNLANLYRHGAQYERARTAYEEVEWELRAIGEQHAAAYTTGNLGDLARDFGDLDGALESYQRALHFARQVGDVELIAESHCRLAHVRIRQSRLGEASRLLTRAGAAARKAHSREFSLRVLLLKAQIDLESDRTGKANKAFTRAAADAGAIGLQYYQLWAQHGQACCLLAVHPRQSLQTARNGLARSQRSGYRWWEFRFAVLGAQAERGLSIRGRRTSDAMLLRAIDLKSQIEGTVGDPDVRTAFAQLPAVRALETLTAGQAYASQPRSDSYGQPWMNPE